MTGGSVISDAMTFVKGHGAHNDFVILPDPEGHLALSADQVVQLCNRHTGIGADGVLRAVRTKAVVEAAPMASGAEWFMDYRNADGSLGSMCGNGIRVFARYLVEAGLAKPGDQLVATRAGVRRVNVPHGALPGADAAIAVEMGHARFPGPEGIRVLAAGGRWSATNVDLGNPHAVAFVDDLRDPGGLKTAPALDAPRGAYPEGVTVEFVCVRSAHHLALRVHERGVGETAACGTGACAAVAAHRSLRGHTGPAHYIADLPGGRLHVAVGRDGAMELQGPAVLVAAGTVELRA